MTAIDFNTALTAAQEQGRLLHCVDVGPRSYEVRQQFVRFCREHFGIDALSTPTIRDDNVKTLVWEHNPEGCWTYFGGFTFAFDCEEDAVLFRLSYV